MTDDAELPERARALLDFWFGPPGDPEREKHREIWFKSTTEFDDALRQNFLADYEAAAAGKLKSWETTPEGTLALLLLLDQVPRNIFRGMPRTYATDAAARAVADRALARGFDQMVVPAWRLFFTCRFIIARISATSAGQWRCQRPCNEIAIVAGLCAVRTTLCRGHRALRALPAPQRDPRAAIDARGDRVYGRARKAQGSAIQRVAADATVRSNPLPGPAVRWFAEFDGRHADLR